MDSSRIRAELTWFEPIDRHEAIARTIAWDRSHPPDLESPDYAAEDAVLAAL